MPRPRPTIGGTVQSIRFQPACPIPTWCPRRSDYLGQIAHANFITTTLAPMGEPAVEKSENDEWPRGTEIKNEERKRRKERRGKKKQKRRLSKGLSESLVHRACGEEATKAAYFVRQPCVRAFNLAARRKMECSSSRFGADFKGVRGGGGGDSLAASYR